MTKALIIAALSMFAVSGAASADCRILGIKYATGAATVDPGGTRIYCNPNGRWQTAPVFNLQARTGPDGRFRPIPQVPRGGYELRQRQAWQLYQQQQIMYERFLGDW